MGRGQLADRRLILWSSFLSFFFLFGLLLSTVSHYTRINIRVKQTFRPHRWKMYSLRSLSALYTILSPDYHTSLGLFQLERGNFTAHNMPSKIWWWRGGIESSNTCQPANSILKLDLNMIIHPAHHRGSRWSVILEVLWQMARKAVTQLTSSREKSRDVDFLQKTIPFCFS